MLSTKTCAVRVCFVGLFAAGALLTGRAQAAPPGERGEGVLMAPASAAVSSLQTLTGGASFGTAVAAHVYHPPGAKRSNT